MTEIYLQFYVRALRIVCVTIVQVKARLREELDQAKMQPVRLLPTNLGLFAYDR